MVLKTTGCSRFKHENRYKKYAPGPKILAKTSKIMRVWFGDLIFGTICLISQDPVHIFQNRFLRWKLVVLSTMNPIIRRIFFWNLAKLSGAPKNRWYLPSNFIMRFNCSQVYPTAPKCPKVFSSVPKYPEVFLSVPKCSPVLPDFNCLWSKVFTRTIWPTCATLPQYLPLLSHFRATNQRWPVPY